MASQRHNGGSSTMVLEPVELDPVLTKQDAGSRFSKLSIFSAGKSLRSSQRPTESDGNENDRNESLPSPVTEPEEREQTWNSPRINLYRLPATFWGFMVMGFNDASYGPLIPYLETYYNLSYTIVALVFLSPFVGYNLAAVLNNSIHMKLGQRGVATIGPVCHLISYIIIALHPPYPVLVIAFLIAGLGNGLEDSGWNAWVGVMRNANEIMGFLHGFYGVGAVIAPLIATSLITKAGWEWYTWYYFMIGFAVLELVTSVHAFWKADANAYRLAHPRTTDAQGSRLKEATLKRPYARVTWLCAFFLLGYVGIEVALGGWIVTFMIRVRHGGAFASGMTATGFWLGLTLGRFTLGFVTPRIGEKLSIALYLPIAMALQLLFWLVPQFFVSAVAVALQGFFIGPMFPAAMVAMTKLLPRHLHVSGIGFAAAFGGSGGALFPYIVGAIAQAKGVQVLQPIILALLAVIFVLWLCLPRLNKKLE